MIILTSNFLWVIMLNLSKFKIIIYFILNYRKNDSKIICVLDEMVLLEYYSDANLQKKLMLVQKWLETEKITEIVSLDYLDE